MAYPVACKVFRGMYGSNGAACKVIQRELKIGARARHINLVRVRPPPTPPPHTHTLSPHTYHARICLRSYLARQTSSHAQTETAAAVFGLNMALAPGV